jgi:hypothetical protein
MKLLALALTLTGIFILLVLLNFSPLIVVSAPSDLSKLADNTKVSTTGKVLSERILYEQTKLLKLNNSLELICSSCPNYQNQTLKVIGLIDKYENKTQISALRVISLK